MPISLEQKLFGLRKEFAQEADERHKKMLASIIPYDSLDELPQIVKEQLVRMPRYDRKPKILVPYYGGTLGMHWIEKDGQLVLVAGDDARELLEPLEKWGLYNRMHVVWFPVLQKPIDSTNARFPHWVTIANAIRLTYDMFDGFTVAGGTDSLRFMTAAMHFMFPNFGKPIIAAAAQKEATGWGSDAPENLAFGLDAASSDISGCHLAMSRKLRDGRHIFKIKDKEYDAFDSPPQYILGGFHGSVELYPSCPRRNPLVNRDNLQYNPNFRDGIFSTEIQPFSNAGSLLHMATDPYTQAILFITYGAGNVRNEPLYEGELTHVDVIKQLHAAEFPFVLGSPMQDGRVESPYETGADAIKAGVIPGGDTTGAALYVKMSRILHDSWWTEEKREKAWEQNLKGNGELRRYNERAMRRIARGWYGVNYREFRRGMYINHVGELNMNIVDEAPQLKQLVL